jgi:hypothetical protein
MNMIGHQYPGMNIYVLGFRCFCKSPYVDSSVVIIVKTETSVNSTLNNVYGYPGWAIS